MGTDVIDLKVADTALAEMAEAFRVFQPLRRRKKVTIFGSARTEPDHPAYRQARALAAAMAGAGWMVVTGAGPGIMAAGMEGAGREQSIGVNIRLPHEQGANRFIAQDPKLVEMRYFFTRKLMLLKESDGFIVLPGGFGTLDEGFELLTLLQTGKAEPAPVVLLDVPGGTYWDGWSRFLAEEVEPRGLVAPDDRAFFTITDDVAAASAELLGLLPELPVVPVGRRPARPAHGHPPGHGAAGRPQPPVRRHRDVRRHPQGRSRYRPNGPTTTWSTCPGSPSGSTRSTTDACVSSSTPSTHSSTAEHRAAPVAVAAVGACVRRARRGRRQARPGVPEGRLGGWVLGLDPVVAHQRRRIALGEPTGLVEAVGVDAPVLCSSWCEIHAWSLPYVHLVVHAFVVLVTFGTPGNRPITTADRADVP